MTENTIDKTKRKFTDQLSNSYWTYQVSVFYRNYSDSKKALEHRKSITRLFNYHYPRQPFLYRLCLSSTDIDRFEDIGGGNEFGMKLETPFHTFFTTTKIEIKELENSLCSTLGLSVYLRRRVFDGLKKHKYISTVRRENPHDLTKFFNSEKQIKRWSLSGKLFIPDS